jgi:hypothetical protein
MITPLHIVAALPVKFWYPKQFSLIWFSITNVLIDIEVLYYMALLEWPIHRFFHSLVGVTIIGIVCFSLSLILKHKKLPSFLGCFIGVYSHYIIDGFYHGQWM